MENFRPQNKIAQVCRLDIATLNYIKCLVESGSGIRNNDVGMSEYCLLRKENSPAIRNIQFNSTSYII